jgi:Fe2+ transport system protein FeoA
MHTDSKLSLINLNEASVEKRYKIIEIKDRQLQLKLMEMGCMPEMFIEKISAAPFNGPLLIKIFPGANLLAIRREQCLEIILSEL